MRVYLCHRIEGDMLELKDCLKIHQNGIMSVENIKDDFLVTGGDDNEISLTKLDRSTGILKKLVKLKMLLIQP